MLFLSQGCLELSFNIFPRTHKNTQGMPNHCLIFLPLKVRKVTKKVMLTGRWGPRKAAKAESKTYAWCWGSRKDIMNL